MCIFCDIIEGKIPSKKVYEDDEVLAILDISQATRGHTLVMPKKHYDNCLAMPAEEFASLMAKAQMITKDETEKLKARGCNLLINTNEVAGQSVMHTHVHILPRYDENDTVTFQFQENESDLDQILAELKTRN